MQSRDFQSMQAQAIDYARQMYEKSAQTKSENNFGNSAETNYNHTKSNPAGNNSFFRNNINRINNIFSVTGNSNSSDGDMSLILALILLLSKDSGDNILILALLYIMS